MPSRVMDILRRWKSPLRKTDRALPLEGPRDPRLPPEPDAMDAQVEEQMKRRAILKKLAQ